MSYQPRGHGARVITLKSRSNGVINICSCLKKAAKCLLSKTLWKLKLHACAHTWNTRIFSTCFLWQTLLWHFFLRSFHSLPSAHNAQHFVQIKSSLTRENEYTLFDWSSQIGDMYSEKPVVSYTPKRPSWTIVFHLNPDFFIIFKMYFRGISVLIYNSWARDNFSLYREFMSFLWTQ